MGKDCKSALTNVGLIFSAYNLRRIFNLIYQNFLQHYLKVLTLYLSVLTPVFNAFYKVFYFKNEKCFFRKRILVVF